jgi:hypothetical protein
LKIVNQEVIGDNLAPIHQIKIIPFNEKEEWQLVAKYNIGVKKE